MRVLDLFSGIGGFALGLESVGFQTIGFCEIEAFPRAVLAHHWPHVPIHDDVRTLSAESVPWLRAEAERGIDLICGGFPCQDISVAGKGAGLSGARSGLWRECSRLVGELRPRWALFENVGALKQRGIDRVCSDLEGHGYAVWPLLVGAGVGVGAPHRRDRVWIVAHRQSGGQRVGGSACHAGDCGDSDGGGTGLGHAQHDDGRADEPGRGQEGGTAARWSGASELDNSDAGRRGREGDPVQAGRDEPERPDSAVGLADRHQPGLRVERGSELQHGVGAAQRDDADRRGERPVGDAGRSGSQELRRDWNQRLQDLAGGCTPRWPARPGEPQHDWEEPRLAYSTGRNRHASGRHGESGPAPGNGAGKGDGKQGVAELALGSAVDGLPVGLVRELAARHGLSEAFVAEWWTRNRLKVERAHNRDALKAYGNSVVPQVVAIIGKAILEADREQR